jgi:hypothetical protein
MANEDHVVQIKEGVKVWNAWRKKNPSIVPDLRGANFNSARLRRVNLNSTILIGANLREADLGGAKLIGANLREADLGGANLIGANLIGAKLSRADLGGANLIGANLMGAKLSRADLSGADLCGVNLCGVNLGSADLRQTTLIDSRLNCADLTGTKLWESQRGGWSINGIICQRAFWDRDGEEATEYEDGAFERIFAEKPRIELHYAGGMSPVDLAMLPIIVERLQADHPASSLHIRSVQDDGTGGATVTITVEDLADRSDEAFARDVEVMRGDLATLQQRLQQEERLRLEFEAKYSAVVHDILPKLLERALPKTEVHVGYITGPTTIEGTAMSRDTYTIHGQTGAVGPNAHTHDMIFKQIWSQSSIDLPRLAEELKRLRAAMKEADGKDEQDEAIGAVAAAEKTATKGDGPTTLGHLKTAGKWTLGVAEKIGVAVAAEAIKRAM